MKSGDSDDERSKNPEDINRCTYRPVLRPGGSLQELANAVDRAVHEERERAKQAKELQPDATASKKTARTDNGWGARLNESRKRGIGYRLSKDCS